jgi:hypothetical protein
MTLSAGGTITFTGTYQSQTTGTINVTTNLSTATFSITGPANYSGSGTSFTQTNAPPGTYTITYGPVSGYTAPTPQTMTLSAGGTITFTGTYQSQTTGTINVTTNLSTATFSITGPANYSGSGTSFTQNNAPTGAYTIAYGPVSGYAAPSSQTMTLSAGGTIAFTGTYNASSATSTLRICADALCQTFSTTNVLLISPSRLPRPVVGCALITFQPQTVSFAVGCFDSQSGKSVQNCNVSLSVAPVSYSGGHNHDDTSRPAGNLDVTSGSTGSSGLAVTYTAPEVSGQVTLSLSGTQSNGTPLVSSTATIDVGVSGLAATPGPSPYYSLPGGKPIHPNNHFAFPYVNTALVSIAQDFANAFPGNTLLYNDLSLVAGGIFDIDAIASAPGVGNWAPPHCGHLSLGGGTNNADIMISGYSLTGSVPKPVYKTLKDIITKYHGTICVTHKDHWHLCF